MNFYKWCCWCHRCIKVCPILKIRRKWHPGIYDHNRWKLFFFVITNNDEIKFSAIWMMLDFLDKKFLVKQSSSYLRVTPAYCSKLEEDCRQLLLITQRQVKKAILCFKFEVWCDRFEFFEINSSVSTSIYYVFLSLLCFLRKHKWPFGILGRGPSKRISASWRNLPWH